VDAIFNQDFQRIRTVVARHLRFLAETLGHALRQTEDLVTGTDVTQIDNIAIEEI
jgi:hypothetical protein